MTATASPGRALPRGIRNHNPGNLRRSADPWQGLAATQTDAEFFQFSSAKWGIRALARTLIAYQDKVGLRNIKQMIGRWAPPVENDTGAYVRVVAAAVGVGPEEQIDVHDYAVLRPLVLAIIKHENGQQPYTDAEVDAGLVLAGVEPPQRPLNKTRTVQGGQLAASATVLGLTAEAVRQVEPAIPLLQTLLQVAPWVVGAAALAGIAYMIWARIDDRRRGLR
ncbi:MAG: structural protein P5 [Methylobacterium sp.]|nr:structural protein P5 [Methylobacterium sp.]MCA3704605.1 structural protein P5 [Methylobacterium sp.]